MHAEKVQSSLIQEIRNNLPNYNKLHNNVITTEVIPLIISINEEELRTIMG